VTGGINGRPVTGGHKYRGWGLDARLTALHCNKITVTKYREVKTGWNICQNIVRKAVSQKVLLCQ
jgi:hypothetical protein